MINFQQYIQENLQIDLGFIFEANKKIWPPIDKKTGRYKYSPISIMIGDHVEDRKSERHVEDKEIINAIMGAKDEILKKLKSGELKVSRYSKDKSQKLYTFVIMDARKDKQYPLTVVGFISWADQRFKMANAIIKTVGKYKDFSSIMRKDSEYEKHIYLY